MNRAPRSARPRNFAALCRGALCRRALGFALCPSVLLLLASCVPLELKDHSDAGRRRGLLGHWHDQYMQGASYAEGDTVYKADGTFTSSYESTAPGLSAQQPTRRASVRWAGKWRIENGQLIEDILTTSDATRTPADRPMIRSIAQLDSARLLLRNGTGNVNAYARKKPAPPSVSYTPSSG